MASLPEILQDRLDRFDSVPLGFVTATQEAQRELFVFLQRLLGEMDTVDGRLVISEANIARIDIVVNRMLEEGIMRGEYREGLKSFLSEFPIQADLQNQWFAQIVSNFSVQDKYLRTLTAARQNTLAALTDRGLYSSVLQPIRQQITASVSTGETFTGAVDRLERFILGNDEVDGKLVNHVKTIAYDAFAFNDRAYGEVVSEDLGLVFFRYQGGLVKDSRDFCIKRNGKYFHKEEIKDWGTLSDWGGRAAGTDEETIFYFLGGYNCKHSLIPNSVFNVPEEDVINAISKGYYEPSQQVREQLDYL